jgi:site-specific DNA recombinase
MPVATDTLAREYLRVSRDKSGRLRSPDEQHRENERGALAEGWHLGAPYAEAGALSASRYARKARPGFAALTADLEHDRFGARVLILWECSRGSRRVSEWARFIELLEERQVLVYVTTHGRVYDPSRPRDRHTLHEEGNDNAYDSDKISERVRRAMNANAADGKPHGKAPYGYRRHYRIGDGGRRELIGQVPEDSEARVVREIFAGIGAGVTLRALAARLNERGVAAPGGGRWDGPRVGEIGRNAAYAGWRVHGNSRTEATWPKLVARAHYQAVLAILSDESRRTWRPGRSKHLLSYIAACAACGSLLTVRYRRRGGREERAYSCRDRGHVSITQDALDEYITYLACQRLARPDVWAALTAAGDDPAAQHAKDEIGRLRDILDEMTTEVSGQRMSVAAFTKIEGQVLPQIEALERQLASLQVAPAVLSVLAGPSVEAAWGNATVACRRVIVRELFEYVKVGPAERARWTDVADRVDIRWSELPGS